MNIYEKQKISIKILLKKLQLKEKAFTTKYYQNYIL